MHLLAVQLEHLSAFLVLQKGGMGAPCGAQGGILGPEAATHATIGKCQGWLRHLKHSSKAAAHMGYRYISVDKCQGWLRHFETSSICC
jgi:hypothetical protein